MSEYEEKINEVLDKLRQTDNCDEKKELAELFIGACLDMLNSAECCEEYLEIYDKLKNNYFPSSGFTEYDEGFFGDSEGYRAMRSVCDNKAAKHLYEENMRMVNAEAKNIIRFANKFLFPFDDIPENSNIVLYGAGAVGEFYYKQIMHTRYCTVRRWVDRGYAVIGAPVSSPLSIKSVEYDYILIAIERRDIAEQVKDYLLSMDVPEEKIIWNDLSAESRKI